MLVLNILYTLCILFALTTAEFATDEVFNVILQDENDLRSSENTLYDNYEEAKVDVKFYYECLCPFCIKFTKTYFSPVIEKLNQYLNIHVYPYGNARTIERGEDINFKCQHGPAECYGNKLHACAIDYLQNITKAVLFNSCMMDFKGDHGSNDRAADRCASSMSLDSNPIKTCAKGEKGTELLKYYGEESAKANFSFVPYVLINGKLLLRRPRFMKDICAEFTIPPPPCVELYTLS